MPINNPEHFEDQRSWEERFFDLRSAVRTLCGYVAAKTNNPKLKEILMSNKTDDLTAIQAVSTFIDTEVASIADLTNQLATALAEEANQDDTPDTHDALKALQDKIAAIQAANTPPNPAASASLASTVAGTQSGASASVNPPSTPAGSVANPTPGSTGASPVATGATSSDTAAGS